MIKPKYTTIAILRSAEIRVEKDLRFSIECKNTGQIYEYDLGKKQYSKDFRSITEIVAWAIYSRRDIQGHLARKTILQILPKFYDFLRIIGVHEPHELDRLVLAHFAEWLKHNTQLSYPTAASLYRKMSPVFIQMSKHEKINGNFIPIKNAFPKSSTHTTSSTGYDQLELKSIINAAVKGIRESASRLETKYKPQWIGKPPPVEDVAPIGYRGRRSKWASQAYRVWWWENHCHCKRLNSTALFKMPQGQCFYNSLSSSKIGSIKLLENFYDQIGAGIDYRPSLIGEPNPIKYLTPWKKRDYLIWYWENNLSCKPLFDHEAKKKSPEFSQAIKDHYGGRIQELFHSLGVSRQVKALDLIPYYLMLLIRTQLNPTTLQRLTIDCLDQDPLNDNRKYINWTKLRSFSKGKTIPIDKENDGWPIRLVERVIQITDSIRDGQLSIWLSNSNQYKKTLPLGMNAFAAALRVFSEKHGLRTTAGKPLYIQAPLIRPTMAWGEYLRTEDMLYLKTLLGHTKLSTTADYLRRIDDPILRSRRAVHQEAMFIGLSAGTGIKKVLLDVSVPPQRIEPYEAIFNHCKNPFNSPIKGQKNGDLCTVNHEVCLGCQNLVITPNDIKKYFCYIFFHDYLLDSGDIDEKEYRSAISEKRFIWTEYILPKYSKSLIEKMKTEASVSPIPEWDISNYENNKNESLK